jgi:hypothetical protein
MNATTEDVKDMLEAESFGLTFGTNLFISDEPLEPDSCVTLYDTPGLSSQLTMDNERYDYPSVTIRVRDMNYTTGWAMVENIKSAMHGRANETWNGTFYALITVVGHPFKLDYDNNRRVRFIININLQRR